MTKTYVLVAAIAIGAIVAGTAMGSVTLSFEGTVDDSFGFTVGSVSAPLGSPFSLDVGIDDGMAATGRYPVESVSYTLVVGSYTTVTDWTSVVELVATQNGPSILLESDPLFAAPDEHFLLSLDGFGTSTIDDPFSWGGPAALFGDIIVRGIGGFAQPRSAVRGVSVFGNADADGGAGARIDRARLNCDRRVSSSTANYRATLSQITTE